MAKRPLGKHFLRQWREFRGLSLRALASKLETDPGEQLMSHANIGRIETLQQPYSQEILEAAAEALECTVIDLLTVDPTANGGDRTPESQLRSALLAFGVDRGELNQVVNIVTTFVHVEKPEESPSQEQSQPANPHRVRVQSR